MSGFSKVIHIFEPFIEVKEKFVAEKGTKGKIAIASIVSLDDLLSPDMNHVICEGEVSISKPNTHCGSLKRWAQITKSEFRYYKSVYHAAQWLVTPLGRIGLDSIDNVRSVENVISSPSSRHNQAHCYYFVISGKQKAAAHPMSQQDLTLQHRSSEKCLSFGFGGSKLLPDGRQQADPLSQSVHGSRRTSRVDLEMNKLNEEKGAKSSGTDSKKEMEEVRLVFKKHVRFGKTQEQPHHMSSSILRRNSGMGAGTELYVAVDKKKMLEKWMFVLNWFIEIYGAGEGNGKA